MLLGLHGLALMVAFPLGPQQARLWHPGIGGIAALVAAFPLATVFGGLISSRLPILPSAPRTLAALALLATLPAVLSTGYVSFFAARVIAGLAAGATYVAVHRGRLSAAAPSATRLTGRIIAFGMPLCLLCATAFDWRMTLAPVLAGFTVLLVTAPDPVPDSVGVPVNSLAPECSPDTTRHHGEFAALVASAALAFVSGSLLTILSGFLVFNAGHTEWHIPAGLLTGATLGLAVPPAIARLRKHLVPDAVYGVALGSAALVLCGLLILRSPVPAVFAVGTIALFLAANSARHIALAGLVTPGLNESRLSGYQTKTHLAHHFGSGLGALNAAVFIHATPHHTLEGLPALIASGLAATALAYAAGLTSAQPNAWPAACAAAANSRWRVATSLLRSVRTSIIRNPGTPT